MGFLKMDAHVWLLTILQDKFTWNHIDLLNALVTGKERLCIYASKFTCNYNNRYSGFTQCINFVELLISSPFM